MNDLWLVQTAVYLALTTPPATYPVYDAVPQGAVYPYIVIGEWSGEPDEELAAASTDAELMMHGWSATAGKKQSHEILAFIRSRLDQKALGTAWILTEDFTEVMEDESSTAASRLYHAVARYRARIG